MARNQKKSKAYSPPAKSVTLLPRRGKSAAKKPVGAPARVVLMEASSIPESKLTSMEKMKLIEGGLSKKHLEQLKQKAGLDYDQLATVLNVARSTLINKKGAAKFSGDLSERIMGLADIYSYGYEVFGNSEDFNEWIFRENKALGGSTPFELLHNQFGREEVKNLIGRIDYGVYS
ncbi:MAG: antitoxin Xre/MbcA/ParS toxin-binding domain-containing protein [Flavisolibacter sp.]